MSLPHTIVVSTLYYRIYDEGFADSSLGKLDFLSHKYSHRYVQCATVRHPGRTANVNQTFGTVGNN